MTAGTNAGTSQQQPARPVASVGDLLTGAVEKTLHQRRAGKYTHPYGGMRQFAEDRAAKSGWDHDCLAFDNLEARRDARSNLAEKISDVYKEEFVRVNRAEGKGRPKANNISAAKKTVRMIAERILLSLEAKATQHLFNKVVNKGKASEKELSDLRQIHKWGRENPKLTYEQIRAMATNSNLGPISDRSPSNEPEHSNSNNHSNHNPNNHNSNINNNNNNNSTIDNASRRPDARDLDERDPAVDAMKQNLIEMRADQISKGFDLKPLNEKWVHQVTAAARQLLAESFSRQLVPKTKVHGCRHFTRKNRVLMVCCGTFTVCRMCHIQDHKRVHDVRIEPVHTMACMMCGEVQAKTQVCRKCDVCFGSYYCDVCGITDDTPGYDLRHCSKCNVCMPGLTFHCDRCKSCVPATPGHDAVCTGAAAGTGAAPAAEQMPQQVATAVAAASPMSVAPGNTHAAPQAVPPPESIEAQPEPVEQAGMDQLPAVESRPGHMYPGL